jgi:uncharacterized membrane protein YkoI
MKQLIVRWGAAALYALGCAQTKVPIETARQTALASVEGDLRTENLDWEHGRWIWEFRIKPTGEQREIVKEVEIDATTGEVLDIEDEPIT